MESQKKQQIMRTLTLDAQPEELSEGQLLIIKEEYGCARKDADLSEKVAAAKNLPLKILSQIS